MDKAEIIKELESLMRASHRLQHRLDDVLYKDAFLNHIKQNKELEPCYIELQKISGDMQEDIDWDMIWIIKEIDPNWDVEEYLKETNYGI
jgi:hypothetical protein